MILLLLVYEEFSPTRLLINLIYVSHIWKMPLLHPDVFVSYSLTPISEFLAAIILTLFLDKWGRRWMGFFSMFICGVFSFVELLMPVGDYSCIPFIRSGRQFFITAILMLVLPETMGQKLPESLKEGNDFGREQSFWCFPCINCSPVKKKSKNVLQ